MQWREWRATDSKCAASEAFANPAARAETTDISRAAALVVLCYAPHVVTQALDHEIAEVLAGFPEVTAAWIFGSEARGEARPDSDLDLALLLRDRTQTARDAHLLLGGVAAHLEGIARGRKVDVVLVASQGPILQHRVLSEGRLVFDVDPTARIDFESDVYVRYFDFYPTYDLARRHAISGFRGWFEGRR